MNFIWKIFPAFSVFESAEHHLADSWLGKVALFVNAW